MNQSEYASNLVTVEEAAELAGVSTSTLHQWRRRGVIHPAMHATMAGHRRVLYRRGDVAALVQRTCAWCGATYTRTSLRQEYCTPTCRKNAHRLRTDAAARG